MLTCWVVLLCGDFDYRNTIKGIATTWAKTSTICFNWCVQLLQSCPAATVCPDECGSPSYSSSSSSSAPILLILFIVFLIVIPLSPVDTSCGGVWFTIFKVGRKLPSPKLRPRTLSTLVHSGGPLAGPWMSAVDNVGVSFDNHPHSHPPPSPCHPPAKGVTFGQHMTLC